MNKDQHSNIRRSTHVPNYDIKTTTPMSLRHVPKPSRPVFINADMLNALREDNPRILAWKRQVQANLARIRRDKAVSTGLTTFDSKRK